MPTLTAAQIHKLNKDPITDPHVLLIEIEEEHTGVFHAYTTDNQDVVSNGVTYVPATIEFSIPKHGEEQEPVTVSVSNVHRAPGRALILSTEAIMVRMMAVDVSDPDTLLIDTLDMFQIAGAPIDSEAVDAELGPVIDWQHPVPFLRTTKDRFPGVWV